MYTVCVINPYKNGTDKRCSVEQFKIRRRVYRRQDWVKTGHVDLNLVEHSEEKQAEAVHRHLE